MPGSLRKMPVWLPIIILLVAMASIQTTDTSFNFNFLSGMK